MHCYDVEHLNLILNFCKSNNIPSIVDEIFTGFGRTGTYFAFEQIEQFQFDICCLSKCLTGGYLPLGVTLLSETIINDYKKDHATEVFLHGHSYTGNPLACAVAHKSLQLFEKYQITKLVKQIELGHLQFLKRINNNQSVAKAWVCGSILAVELSTKEESGYYNTIKPQIMTYFMERGIYVRPLGNIIYIIPSYLITKKQLEKIYTCMQSYFKIHGAEV